jgi:hypothetical protein
MATGDPSGTDRVGNRSALTDAANVLVLSGPMSSDGRRSYLDQVVPSPLDSLLVVSYAAQPVDWLEEWERTATVPEEVVLVGSDERDLDRSGVTRVAQSPEDLTGIGITVSERLTEWHDPLGEGSLFVFDSLTVLLQYVELKRAFRFLHVVANRVKSTDAVAHYHLDPGAHDAQTVATLSSLFDTVVSYEDGHWAVSEGR